MKKKIEKLFLAYADSLSLLKEGVVRYKQYKYSFHVATHDLAAIVLVGILAFAFSQSLIDTGILSGIVIALVGWYVGVGYSKSKTRQGLELKATEDILVSFRDISAAVIDVYVRADGTVYAKPLTIPANFWSDKGYAHFEEMTRVYTQLLDASGAFYLSIETNELTIVKLWQYYRFINLKIDDFANELNDVNSAFLTATNKSGLSEDEYNESLKLYSGIRAKHLDIVSFLIDFRKLLLNEFQSAIFNRKLTQRKPFDGTKTLEALAKKRVVARKMYERDREFREKPSSGLPHTS